jgi:hypothetical protein
MALHLIEEGQICWPFEQRLPIKTAQINRARESTHDAVCCGQVSPVLATERTSAAAAYDVRLRGDTVAKVENRTTPKISQKLIFGLLCDSIAFQSRQEGPWSILEEAIRSLTSPRVKRTSGSRIFRTSPPKEFFNTIGRTADKICSL